MTFYRVDKHPKAITYGTCLPAREESIQPCSMEDHVRVSILILFLGTEKEEAETQSQLVNIVLLHRCT